MKKYSKVIYLSVIVILLTIIVIQTVRVMQMKNANENILSLEFLQQMVDYKKRMLEKTEKELVGKAYYVESINDLTEYCIKNNSKDSLSKFIAITNGIMSNYNIKHLINNLTSGNKQQRLYAFKMIEYLLFDEVITSRLDHSLIFNCSSFIPISNAMLNNGVLKQNQDYKAFYVLAAANCRYPIKLSIEGERDSLYSPICIFPDYTRPSTKKGKQVVKGTVTYMVNGKPETYNFEDQYTVE